MNIVSIDTRPGTRVLGRLSDGSDRQTLVVAEHRIVIDVDMTKYEMVTNNQPTEEYIQYAYDSGWFNEIPKSQEQAMIEQLEAENADLWFDKMMKDAENEQEFADLWYMIMTGGGSI